VKNHKIANNSALSEAGEKISKDLESLELKKIDACFTSFKDTYILLNNITFRFLVTTKLCTG